MGGLLIVEDTPFLLIIAPICQLIRPNFVALPFSAQKISDLIISITYGCLKAKNANLLLNFSLNFIMEISYWLFHLIP